MRGAVLIHSADVSAETPCADFHKVTAALPGNDAAASRSDLALAVLGSGQP
jgi:hypothetical protein